jgi:zinc finger FYVE domain-containing protein 26
MEMGATFSTESSRVGQKQRPLGLLHQMIDDAFKGKRQFLSGIVLIHSAKCKITFM